MAENFYTCIIAAAGFAGEYEALTEGEIAAAPGAAYSPPENTGNFRVVASRVVQLLAESPIFIQTFQTTAAEVRLPSGLTASNDAGDGRVYIIKNASSATGILTIANHLGTSLLAINPGDIIIAVHGDNNVWELTDPISGTDGFGGTFRYTRNNKVPGSGTRYLRTGQGVDCSSAGDRLIRDVKITGISIRTNVSDGSRDYDVEVVSNPSGTPSVLATLALPSGSNSEGDDTLAVDVSAPTEIGVRLVRTSGSGSSAFNRINVNVQVG